jgi:hypothetical protein
VCGCVFSTAWVLMRISIQLSIQLHQTLTMRRWIFNTLCVQWGRHSHFATHPRKPCPPPAVPTPPPRTFAFAHSHTLTAGLCVYHVLVQFERSKTMCAYARQNKKNGAAQKRRRFRPEPWGRDKNGVCGAGYCKGCLLHVACVRERGRGPPHRSQRKSRGEGWGCGQKEKQHTGGGRPQRSLCLACA